VTVGDPSAAVEARPLRAVESDDETVPLFRHHRPAIHAAAHEDEPRSGGLEIR
jgi:hypothetical protein